MKWGRRDEFGFIDTMLYHRTGMTFLEFGTIRDIAANISDGHSTAFLTDLAKRTGSTVYSCDISDKAIATAKEVLVEYGLYPTGNLTFIHGDALDTAIGWNRPLDLLLLDGCAEWPTKDEQAFAERHLDVFRVLERWLQPGAVVMVDDLQVRAGLVVPYMKERGWKVADLSTQRKGDVLYRD